MQTKWNQFVYLLCEAKKKNVEENDYHSLIEQQLQLLGWFLFNGEICHKPSVLCWSICLRRREYLQVRTKAPNTSLITARLFGN